MMMIHHSKLLYDARSKTFVGMRYHNDPPKELFIKGKSSTYLFRLGDIQSVLCDMYVRDAILDEYTLELYHDTEDMETRWDMLRVSMASRP